MKEIKPKVTRTNRKELQKTNTANRNIGIDGD